MYPGSHGQRQRQVVPWAPGTGGSQMLPRLCWPLLTSDGHGAALRAVHRHRPEHSGDLRTAKGRDSFVDSVRPEIRLDAPCAARVSGCGCWILA
jgi:hypothetical protein